MGCTASQERQQLPVGGAKKELSISEVSVESQETSETTTSIQTRKSANANTDGQVLAFLKENQFFKSLGDGARKKVLELLRVKTYEKGETILDKESEANAVYLVVSGRVCLMKANRETSRVVCANGTFNEASFFFKTKRTFSAVAREHTILLEMTRDTFLTHGKSKYLRGFANFVEMSARHLVSSQLSKVDMFRDFSPERVLQLSNYFRVKVVTKGETIFREGDSTESGFFVLGSGELVVTLNAGKQGLEIMELKTLRAGATFGELSLLESKPRTATITSMSDATLFVLSRAAFERFLTAYPEIQKSMTARLKERKDMNKLARNIPFMQSLKPNKLLLLSQVCVPLDYSPNQTIFTQGSKLPNMFYILAKGSVDVLLNNSKIKTLNQKGQYFGELSVVSERPHSATIVAGKHGARCLACTKEEFESVFADELGMFAEVTLKVLGRQAELKHFLTHPVGRQCFLKHCEAEFAAENVAFYAAAEEFEHMGNHQVRRDVLEALGLNVDDVVSQRFEELKTKVHVIYDQFIDPRGPEPVNIKASIRESIEQQLREGEYSYEIFSEAKAAIYVLLERDNFARFCKSKAFEDFLANLGVYNDAGSRTSLTKNIHHLSKKKLDTTQLARRTTVNNDDVQRIRQQIV